MITNLIPSFNAGELSPDIHLRSDLEKYRSGCRTLENMIITPYGGAERRAGFAYTATAPGQSRLFTFQAAIDQGYIIEVSEGQMRFFKRDAAIQSGGSDYTVSNPYTVDDLGQLQFIQINSIAYFTHPSYAPYKLSRIADASWTFAPVDFTYPAMLDENLVSTKNITTAAGAAAASIAVSTDFDLFETLHEGAFFQISHERPDDEYEVKITAVSGNNGAFSSEIQVQGSWDLSTYNTWNGSFIVQRFRNGAWETIRTFTAANDANYTAGGEESELTRYRLGWVHGGNGSGSPYAVLEASGSYLRGLVQIDTVNSARSAQATVVQAVQAGATQFWREGAWSDINGYPRTVAAHEQRIIYGGNDFRPQTVWGSAVDDYENFNPGVEDGDSFTHTLVSGQQNDIQWMISAKALLIGTSGDEWVMSAKDQDGVITPTTVSARRHSGNGSDFVMPNLVDENILFTQRGGKVLREMRYSFQSDGYVTQDLTLLASHIATGGIIDTAWQTQPQSLLWCVTGDGKLLGLTYDRSQNIIGWHRHETGASSDGFESVAVKKTQGENDQVWVVVRRTINGSVVRYVERLNPDGFFLETPWSLGYPSTFGVDSWTQYEQPVSQTAWAGALASYTAGDIRYSGYFAGSRDYPFTWTEDTDELYYCLISHTVALDDVAAETSASPLNHDTIPGENWVRVEAWQPLSSGYSFVLNNYAYDANKVYICIQAHTKSTALLTNTSYWTEVTTYSSTPLEWRYKTPLYSDAPADTVPALDEVQNLGRVYDLSTVHEGYTDKEPGVSAGFDSWWDLQYSVYTLADQVVYGGIVYECILGHTSSATTEPTVGATWETYWEVVQTDFALDDLVSEGGVNYSCILTHTPSAATRPGIGASWATYWELQISTPNLLFFVDSGMSQFSVTLAADEFTGLDHLEGETVQIVAEGKVLTPRTVTSGKITLDQDGDPTGLLTDISVGLGFESILEPMALELGLANGTSVSREKRIHEIAIFFKDSYGCKVSDSLTGDFENLKFYDSVFTSTPTLFTGVVDHRLEARHTKTAVFVIKQDLPLPMIIQAVVPKYNIYGDNM